MHAPSVVRRQAIAPPLPAPLHERVDPATTPGTPAANDDTTSAAAEYRPNPLWAVNVAMAAFFLVAALVIASG